MALANYKRPLYERAYQEGLDQGFSVKSVRQYSVPETGKRYLEIRMGTPYQAFGSELEGYGVVHLDNKHIDGHRDVDTLEFYLENGANVEDVNEETGGSRDAILVDDNGQIPEQEAARVMGRFAAAASEYPHVMQYPEFLDFRKEVNQRMGLDAPTVQDYSTYLDHMREQMRSGDVTFIGEVQTPSQLTACYRAAEAVDQGPFAEINGPDPEVSL